MADTAPTQIEEEIDRFKKRLLRTKTILSQSSVDEEGSAGGGASNQGRLEKVLSTFDLISLGVGSCAGTGMYVVAGLVARNVAGPAVVLSFLIAALASILSGVCYAEFGVRVPKTSGSAYMYSYVTVGEFVAFLIGWNLILEYVIGSAAGASALSACFDALGNHSMSNYLEEHVGTIIGKTYPDFLGCFICLAMTVVLSLGVRGSVRFNHVLNGVNFLVWIFIFIAGMVFANGENWTGAENFAPYGTSGVFSGAATCFYAFIGFDIIATTGEEARNASKSIPVAIVGSLVICLTAYVTVSMVVTLVIPYDEIHGDSALIDMFVQRGFSSAKYVVALGAVAALTVSLLGSMFPMPRVIYAMSRDGLLFGFLSHINERTGTPLIATVVTGVFAALMSLLVGLQILVEMMSIGTLLAYTLVSVSVMILRYQPSVHEVNIPMAAQLEVIQESEVETMVDQDDVFMDPKAAKRQMKDDHGLLSGDDKMEAKWYGALPFSGTSLESKVAMLQRHQKMLCIRLGFPGDDVMPNENTAKTAILSVGLLILSELATALILVFGSSYLVSAEIWVVVLLLIAIAACVACLVVILRQPQNKKKLQFMAPCVPLLPSAAVLFNFYLMLKLPPLTWARLGVWICLGLLLYFSYSMWHSAKERSKSTTQPHPTELPSGHMTDITADTTADLQQTSLQENGHVANGIAGKGVNSPPGGPPNRPPPPRQESIEKFLKRSSSTEADSIPSSQSAPRPRPTSDRPSQAQTQHQSNHRSDSHRSRPSLDRSTDGHHTSTPGPTHSVQQTSKSPRLPNDTTTAHRRLTHNNRLEGETDPFALEERRQQKKTTPRITYDSSTARPRPRPQGRLGSGGEIPGPGASQSPEALEQRGTENDPFQQLEKQW